MKEPVSLLILFRTIAFALKWNTETLSTTCIQGNNHLLMWNFITEENEKLIELQWFLNETTQICLDSKTDGFFVEPSYEGRVERNGAAGILLKSVSLNDTGNYILYVKLDEEKEQNVQGIFLTVVEQVPYQCKPVIEIHPQNVMYCSTSSCERSELSPEWIYNGTRSPMGIGRYLKINEGINVQAFCCLRDLKSHDDDQFKFCMPSPISSTEFTLKDNIVKGTNYEANGTGNQTTTVLIILVVLVVIMVFAVVGYKRCKSYKSPRDLNQNIQVNIHIDANFLKHIVESQGLLPMEAKAREEPPMKKRQILTLEERINVIERSGERETFCNIAAT